jgi:hypothetical protein
MTEPGATHWTAAPTHVSALLFWHVSLQSVAMGVREPTPDVIIGIASVVIVHSTWLSLALAGWLVGLRLRWRRRSVWATAEMLLGFFSVPIVYVLIAVCVAFSPVAAWCTQQLAHLPHRGPGWLGEVAACSVRAAPLVDDWMPMRPVTRSRPSPSRCTASSFFVQVAELAAGAALLLRVARSAVGTLHNRGGTELDCFSATGVASSQTEGGGRRRKAMHELKDVSGITRRCEGAWAVSASTRRSTSRSSGMEAVGAAVTFLGTAFARAPTASERNNVKVGAPDLLLATSFVGASTLARPLMRRGVVGVPSCLLVTTSAGTSTAPAALAREARLRTPCVARFLIPARWRTTHDDPAMGGGGVTWG